MERKIQEWKVASQAIANLIRKKSEAGQLVIQNEILHELREQSVLKSERGDDPNTLITILKKTMETNDDIKEIQGLEGASYYYSSQYMSETYSRILLQKEGNPLQLIAEIVRENSVIYPRPIPLDTFKNSPLGMTQEEILMYLQQMIRHDEYKDIAQTTTSAGTVFLYSTAYLNPDYASMLAEWLDVGQFNNP